MARQRQECLTQAATLRDLPDQEVANERQREPEGAAHQRAIGGADSARRALEQCHTELEHQRERERDARRALTQARARHFVAGGDAHVGPRGSL